MAESALIAIDIDLALVNRKLAESSNLTKKEAKEIERELKASYKKATKAAEDYAREAAKATSKAARDAERAARQAARATEQSFNEQASAVRGLFSAAIGGVGGDLLDLADATDGVSESMALLGVSLGTLAIAPVIIGEITQALKDTAQAGLEARDSLAEAGIMVDQLFTPAQLAALEAYEENLFQNQQAANKLATELGAKVAPAASKMDDAFLGLQAAGGVLVDVFGGIAAGIASVSEAALMSPISLNPLKFLIQEAGQRAGETKAQMDALAKAEQQLAVEARNTARALEEQEQFLENSADYLDVLGMNFPTVEVETRRVAKATKEHGTASKQAAADVREHQQALADAKQAAAEQSATFQALNLNYQDATINAGLTAEAAAELTAHFEQQQLALVPVGGAAESGTFIGRFADDLGRAIQEQLLLAEAMSPILGNLQQLAQLEGQQHAKRVAQLREQRKEAAQTYQDALAEYEASKEGMTETEQAAAEESLRLLQMQTQGQEAAARKQAQEERKAALEAFKRVKALQIAAATIESVRNGVALTAAFAFAGPMAPVLATGVAAGQLGTAIALINAQPPPRFHFGTSAAAPQGGPVDIPGRTMPALLEQGEGVVSRRGMATPGAAELVDMLNLGTMGTAEGAITDLQADMLAQRLNRPYAPSIRGRAMAGTNRFYRGR